MRNCTKRIRLELDFIMPSENHICPTKSSCTGCGACARACPKSCINLLKNGEGFAIAQVDKAVCVDCGACLRSCPFTSKLTIKMRPQNTFAFRMNNVDERKLSASGGAFASLAKIVLDEDGLVCSAVDDIEQGGHFILTDEPSVVSEMLGSKYYYIDLTNDVIEDLIAALEEDRVVLFCGLPCQVYAVRQATKNSSNFIGVDLLCQGAPSYQVVKTYRDEEERKNGSKLVRHSFRNKFDNYRGYTAELVFNGGSSVRKHGDLNLYTCSFQHKLFLREACFRCPFSSSDRVGDITIGDFWGLESFDGDSPSEVSLILCNSVVGEDLISKLHSYGKIEPHSLEEAVKGNAPLRGPVQRPLARTYSFSLMKWFGFHASTIMCYPKYLIKKLICR